MSYQNQGGIADKSGFKESQLVSLYSAVSRGVTGRLSHRPATDARADDPPARTLAVRLPGASMRVLEAGLAATAIVTAILIGVGR